MGTTHGGLWCTWVQVRCGKIQPAGYPFKTLGMITRCESEGDGEQVCNGDLALGTDRDSTPSQGAEPLQSRFGPFLQTS